MRQSYLAVQKATQIIITLLGSRTEPMSISATSPSPSRESEPKQIDHNDSIRSTYLSIENIKAMAATVAARGIDSLPAFAPFDFFARHKENEKEILRVYRTTATDVESGETITPAAEWLLDNHYIVEEAIQEIRRDFPRRFYRELPTINVNGVQIPRTLALAFPAALLSGTADDQRERRPDPTHPGVGLALCCPHSKHDFAGKPDGPCRWLPAG